MSLEELKETYLKIARLLYKKVSVPEICADLNVSGKLIGRVAKLIEAGLIKYDEEGRPYMTVDINEAEEYLESVKRSEKRAAKPTTLSIVTRAVESSIAKEAELTTEQYLTLGKVIWNAYTAYAAKRGWDISKIKENPIHEVVLRALEKEEEYERLLDENEELKRMLAEFQRRVDPIWRLEKGIELLEKYLEFVIIAEEGLGLSVLDSDLSRYYESLIEMYLKGEVGEDVE